MKLLIIILVVVYSLFDLFVLYIKVRSSKNKIPENVSDVYNEDEYKKWTSYMKEKNKNSLICKLTSILLIVFVLTFDILKFVGEISTNVYLSSIIVFVSYSTIETILYTIFEYIDTMKIEEKYGFNKTTKKTFFSDAIINYVISITLTTSLMCLFIYIYTKLGVYTILLFSGILLIIVLVLVFLYPLFSKIYNKFTPLEEGSLREKLIKLLNDNGYKIREIKVMNGSKRSTKANAYFNGAGKTKDIVLYDTILETLTEDEIVAVFAHEVAHGKYKHIIKGYIANIINILLLVGLIYLVVLKGDIISQAFGFQKINYGFLMIVAPLSIISYFSVFLAIGNNYISRVHEYQADKFAKDKGYSSELISSLKKLAKKNYNNLAVSKIVKVLEYSHPTLSERVSALEK